MLNLRSPQWSTLRHAYGEATDIPRLIAQLRAADVNTWDAVNNELMAAILHQGDVYTATYAAIPHLFALAADLGPSKQSDDLLFSIAYAARGGNGPDVPAFLEEAWEDAQDEARELILERLILGEASSEFAGLLIASVLYLLGEWSWGTCINNWVWGTPLRTKCLKCGIENYVYRCADGPKQADEHHNFCNLDVTPSEEPAISPEPSMDFQDETMTGQLLGLAKSSGHVILEEQLRCLFGTFVCRSCGADVPFTSAPE